mgnify:CR=1 FL=1
MNENLDETLLFILIINRTLFNFKEKLTKHFILYLNLKIYSDVLKQN